MLVGQGGGRRSGQIRSETDTETNRAGQIRSETDIINTILAQPSGTDRKQVAERADHPICLAHASRLRFAQVVAHVMHVGHRPSRPASASTSSVSAAESTSDGLGSCELHLLRAQGFERGGGSSSCVCLTSCWPVSLPRKRHAIGAPSPSPRRQLHVSPARCELLQPTRSMPGHGLDTFGCCCTLAPPCTSAVAKD